MKFTIHGFSQAYALTLCKTVKDENGKERTTRIDCTDLLILRWFVDFFPRMKKVTFDGEQYALVTHALLIEDLPLLDISKRAGIDRMQKLVDFGVLKYKLVKQGGTFSFYGFGENYARLIDSESCENPEENGEGIRSNNIGGIRLNSIGGIRSNDIGVYVQTHNKYSSTNSSTNNSIKKESKREKNTETSYDAILSAIEDEDLKKTYIEFIKMRKLIKKPLTDRGLELLIGKLEKLAPGNIAMQKAILEQSIMNNWQGVFPLKDESRFMVGGQASSYAGGNEDTDNVFLQLLRQEQAVNGG